MIWSPVAVLSASTAGVTEAFYAFLSLAPVILVSEIINCPRRPYPSRPNATVIL